MMFGLSSPLKAALTSLALVIVATVIYFLIPVPGQMRETSWGILFGCGAAVLGILIILSVRKLLSAGEHARLRGLILLLTVTVLFFSWADASVAALPGQFAQLHTKTDSLYFNVSTLATVGFGDVHPVGQLARAAVTLQVVFNLVFLGAAVAMISGFMRAKAQGRLHGREQGPAAESKPG
jgi:hypothetical protein